jgi:CRP-like cAMP-binding protein
MGFELDKFYYANSDLLVNVPMRDRIKLEEEAQPKKCKAGKIIYREGTAPKGIYIMRKGKVKVYLSTQIGRKQIINIYTAGELFGYRPVISGEANPVTAMALEDCVMDFIPKEHFIACLQASFELTNVLLGAMSKEYSVLINNIAVFAQYPVRSRVALGLLILREKYKVKGKYGEVNLSRNDLASYVGSVKESVVRVLQDFKRQKFVETQGRKIRILKPEELKAIVTFY